MLGENYYDSLNDTSFRNTPAPVRKSTAKQDASVVQSTKMGKRRDSTWWCPHCKVGLCVKECFEIYHTQKRYYINDDVTDDNENIADHNSDVESDYHDSNMDV